MMKLVSATIPAVTLNALRDTLVMLGVKGMTVSLAKDAPRKTIDDHADTTHMRSSDDPAELMIETVIGDALVAEVAQAILAVCCDAVPCGISIRISDVLRGIRIRNSEVVSEG
jgi:nitrogen regulatory protein PII